MKVLDIYGNELKIGSWVYSRYKGKQWKGIITDILKYNYCHNEHYALVVLMQCDRNNRPIRDCRFVTMNSQYFALCEKPEFIIETLFPKKIRTRYG